MKRLLLILAAVLAFAGVAQAQGPYTGCKTVVPNDQGTAGADITVDTTSGGVAVLAAASSLTPPVRCGAIIKNSGNATMRCAPTTTTVTSTVGFQIAAGESLVLGFESSQAWKCISATSTTASVLEARQ